MDGDEPVSGTRTRATAEVTVQGSEVQAFDSGDGPELVEIHITENFSGGISGESVVRALQVKLDGGNASQVSMQRVCGAIDGREGTFVLQGKGRVGAGKIRSDWFVVPGSGTGALAGLRGDGGFEGEFGKGSRAWLDYWFE